MSRERMKRAATPSQDGQAAADRGPDACQKPLEYFQRDADEKLVFVTPLAPPAQGATPETGEFYFDPRMRVTSDGISSREYCSVCNKTRDKNNERWHDVCDGAPTGDQKKTVSAAPPAQGETPRADHWRKQLTKLGGVDNSLVMAPEDAVRGVVNDLDIAERQRDALRANYESLCRTHNQLIEAMQGEQESFEKVRAENERLRELVRSYQLGALPPGGES